MNIKSNLKKLTIALLLLTSSFFEGGLKAQCGAATSVTLSTQTEVNDFITNNCTNYLGYLTIFDNNDGIDNITDLSPLSTLTAVGERFMIRANPYLTSLNGLQALTTVNAANGVYGLLILGNTALTDISGLSGVTTIGGNLTIQGNSMASFTGLDNLSSVGGILLIKNNDLLTDITSLSNLASIDGYLDISDNALLTSLSGLDNIDPTTMISQSPTTKDINITNNPLLDECEVASICDAYDNNNLLTNITGNATNCVGNPEIMAACAALPVEWLAPVVAKAEENSIALRFSTAVQINNSHFEIEQSQDGSNYHTIGKVEGAGSSSLENHYQYSDEHPSTGMNYYRVKQVDFDGKFEYSNIASAQFKVDEIEIYPNPANEELTVIAKEKQELLFYNQLGQIVERIIINEETNKIDISEFNTGIYYLKIGEKVEILIKE